MGRTSIVRANPEEHERIQKCINGESDVVIDYLTKENQLLKETVNALSDFNEIYKKRLENLENSLTDDDSE